MRDLILIMLSALTIILTAYPSGDGSQSPAQGMPPDQLRAEIDYIEKQIDDCKRVCYPNSSSQYGPDARDAARKRIVELRKVRRQYAKRYNDLFTVSSEEERAKLFEQGLPVHIPLRYE